mgnify:CR=1 FL=1
MRVRQDWMYKASACEHYRRGRGRGTVLTRPAPSGVPLRAPTPLRWLYQSAPLRPHVPSPSPKLPDSNEVYPR